MYHKLKIKLIRIYEWIYQKAYHVKHMFQTRFLYRLCIMSSEETIRHILKYKCSIARYGDGEFSQMIYNYNIGFQNHSDALARKLQENLCARNNNLLICIPKYLISLRKCNKNAREFWLKWGKKNNQQVRVTKLLRQCRGKRYIYGDALITRPYIDLKSKKHADRIFPLLKQLWENKALLIIEGEQTRLGVGNDLFSNAASIQRILAPAKNAFDSYEELMQAVRQHYTGQLILLALGPTATALAADLSKEGMQALDIGHVDIEYEWYLRGSVAKCQVPGKFTNEVCQNPIATPCEDPVYLSEIICSVT